MIGLSNAGIEAIKDSGYNFTRLLDINLENRCLLFPPISVFNVRSGADNHRARAKLH